MPIPNWSGIISDLAVGKPAQVLLSVRALGTKRTVINCLHQLLI